MRRMVGLMVLISFMLAACQGDSDQVVIEEVARPVKTMLVGISESGGMRNFPGTVEAGQRADLSFRVDGKLIELAVKEGDQVKQGQVLAKLDPKDFQVVVDDKSASFKRANADYKRAQKLVGPGHISRMDFDRIEADYKSRLADLKKAKQELSYTILKAPFAGTIAKRYFQNYEEVTLNEQVLALRNNELLEVKINVPENIMQRVVEDEDSSDDVSVSASFDAVPEKSFPLTFKEISTKADKQTKTFQATYTMPAPKGLNILPGMTVTVTADLSRELNADNLDVFYLPVSAVTGDAKLQSRIWVVDEKTMKVHPKPVKLGTMHANQVAVLEGISGQERVVIAGAGYMADGMKVLLMHQPEQAEPRPEDIRFSIAK